MTPHRAIALIDLTSLDATDTDASTRALCARALDAGVAAVCVMPHNVVAAREALGAGSGVRLATVANFPDGADDRDGAARATARAVADGADEVDVVVPWRAWLEDRDDAVVAGVVTACAEHAPVLKAILETGSLGDAAAVRAIADAGLRAGASFVKTSTGKHGQGATPEAARALLQAVRDAGAGGVKVSGGVRTAPDADAYLALADELMGPDWATPATFRIGASSLLDALLAPPPPTERP